jgi:hypothetical protein
MLIREEPLDDFLYVIEMMHDIPPEREAHYQSSIRENMERLGAMLDHNQSNPKKRDLSDAHLTRFAWM